MMPFIFLFFFSTGSLIFSMDYDYLNIFTEDDEDVVEKYVLPNPHSIPKPTFSNSNPAFFLASIYFFWELHVPINNKIANKLFDEENIFLPRNNAEKDAISFMFKPFTGHPEVIHETDLLQCRKNVYANKAMYYTEGFFKVYIPYVVYVRCALALDRQAMINSFNDYVLLYVLGMYKNNNYKQIDPFDIQFLVQEILSNNRNPPLSPYDIHFAKDVFPYEFINPKLGDTLGNCFKEKDEEIKIISVMKQYCCNVERVDEL